MSHTPGPWRVVLDKDLEADKDGWEVAIFRECTVKADCKRSDLGSTLDDARLIAAAPEMLDALEQIKGLLPDCDGGPLGTIENIIDHAIAKAEGR